ncbi:MAG: zinc ABC transporter substrate-binding protein [Bdellovibrio sp.]|nr:zinc ABC transporter substrate-binding protein [Bdellovibrio sp.]
MGPFFKIFLFFIFTLAACGQAQAKLYVVTTTTDLRALVSEIGQEFVTVDSIAKGTQDPHYIEAKPSFMTKVNRADLLISIGLDLEIGWLPNIIQGARNPKVLKGQKGYLEVGPLVEPLEVPTGKISRAQGDVHPDGNPHVTLDPIRVGQIALFIAERLGQLDLEHQEIFIKNAKIMQTRLQDKVKIWQATIDQSGVKKIVTYHKTLSYFLNRFNLENSAILEPKPGIPPTSGHIIEIIQQIKEQKIPLILVENYFDPTVTEKIKNRVPTVRSATVMVAVDGGPNVSTLDALFEHLVDTINGR